MSAAISLSSSRMVSVREVFTLAWPIMVSMLSHTAMSVADTLYVGQLGTAELASVGIATTASYVLIAPAQGLLSGVRVKTAHAVGAQNQAAVNALLHQGLYVAMGLGALALLGVWFGPLLFDLLGGRSPPFTALAMAWWTPRVLFLPLVFLQIAITSWLQAQNDTRTPMVSALVANLLNIALDPLFIWGWGPLPAMGVAGASYATNVAVTVGLLILLFRVRADLWKGMSRPLPDIQRQILAVGSPMAVNALLGVGSWLTFGAMIARLGEASLAAHVIVIRVLMVSFLPGHAISEAATVLVGQRLGAGEPEMARWAWWSSLRLAAGLMLSCAMVFVAIPEALFLPFGATEPVLAVGRPLLFLGACFQFFDAIAMTSYGALMGAEDTRYIMVTEVLSSWLLLLPLGALLAFGLGLGAPGAWLGLTGHIVFLAGLWSYRILRQEGLNRAGPKV